ncbi:hypothetical protein SELMODRAFT_409080 [Selaginella moellendorffii]|uniref:Uncharacterized protein CAT3-2 n=1 Tax=Selaginella moellendorffii TaxID=88036 RepID=D8R9D1_SELML|nr:cationic amino acid transporter 9, chloroplastic [Selaginella moellendorffii]EFJ31138.1 hypothetical protein SELMODRAFT_409080 [Selaginella moellendorffii]|eukprot:XP_002967791.1 cationic amino acid transporter 9, chloroplastic [Selaginella moellendorffii]
MERHGDEGGGLLDSSGDAGLVRKLGMVDLILLGIGASIGAGIFVITGTVAHDAGPGVAVSFALAGAACVLNALCYAELSSRFPALVGGAYLYSRETFNELVGFLVFVHLMFDYHVGAANIARSLASYLASLLQNLFPALRKTMPLWIGPGGLELLNGWLSINALAPALLAMLSAVLCMGVRESATLNTVMTINKVCIVLLVVAVGIFQIDVSNWTPFAPTGFSGIVTGATVVFFAYVGFDAVANSAEESKNPKRDLPIGIIASLLVCAVLYIAVSLVVTGMVPYYLLDGEAPLANAFSGRGLKFISVLIDIGAVFGLTTTLLVGLYVQSRLYLGLGRDGLLPSIFARIHPTHHTPVYGQLWVATVAGVLALVLDVSHLSHILSVGCLVGYATVCACVVMLRLRNEEQRNQRDEQPRWREAVFCLLGVAVLGLIVGILVRFKVHFAFSIAGLVLAALVAVPLYTRQEYRIPQGFPCPWVPTVPLVSIFFNMALFSQLHWEAFVRFVILSVAAVAFFFLYGKKRPPYQKASVEEH